MSKIHGNESIQNFLNYAMIAFCNFLKSDITFESFENLPYCSTVCRILEWRKFVDPELQIQNRLRCYLTYLISTNTFLDVTVDVNQIIIR